jgi:hypothetical protein
MKKDDAMDKLDRAGFTIHDLNTRAWNTALNPTSHGWASSILSLATIPVLSAASLGHLVGSAVVKQIDPNIFERITKLGDKDKKQP